MEKKNRVELWDVFKEKDFCMEQILGCLQDITKLQVTQEKEDLSILHGYCNLISAYIVKIYDIDEKIKELQNDKSRIN